MKLQYWLLTLTLCFGLAHAETVSIANTPLGSGTPGVTNDYELAAPVLADDIFFAPQYMPAYPTAATIWPRVVEVPCTESADGNLKCTGYQWTPKLGRGEYLFFKPVLVKAPDVKIVPMPILVPGPERIILKEVPYKKKTQ